MRSLFVILTLLILPACGPAPGTGASLRYHRASILGGSPVAPGDPVAASVVEVGPAEGFRCSGTLVGPRLVVTAAHCLDKRHRGQFTFRPGFEVRFGGRERRPLEAWEIHPDWDERIRRPPPHGSTLEQGDLALVRFTGEAPAGFRPARFAPPEAFPARGEPVRVAGFGRAEEDDDDGRTTGTLRSTSVPLSDRPADRYEFYLDQRSGRGVCRGDSGGPAFVLGAGEPLLIGVASRAADFEDSPNALCRRTSVFTDQAATKEWREAAARRLGETISR